MSRKFGFNMALKYYYYYYFFFYHYATLARENNFSLIGFFMNPSRRHLLLFVIPTSPLLGFPARTSDGIKRLNLYQNSLIDRLTLMKVDTPWRYEDLRHKLQEIWKVTGTWRMISLGKGFFTFLSENMVDRDRVRKTGTWAFCTYTY